MENGSCIDNSINKPVKLSEIDVQNIDWVDKTYGFNYLGVSTVIKAIGITNEEKRSLIEILCKAARENNITLEPNVFEIMEQEYVFYGGSKETFGVIGRMKLKNIKEKVDVISKVDNMTQGEILTAMAPIDTMISICKDNCGKPLLVLNDVNMIMPFVVKAQKAAEKISRFALDHFNSRDEHKRELSKLICGRFQMMLVEMDNVTFNGYKNDTTVDWLNNNVRSVTDMLFNTIEACENLVDDSTKTSGQKNAIDMQLGHIAELEKENAELKAKLAQKLVETNDEENEELKNIKQLLAQKEAIIKEQQCLIEDYSARFDPKDIKKKPFMAMTGKQHIIFFLAVLAHLKRLPNSRRSMSFLMSFIASRNESTMEDYLGDAISKEECETLAKVFDNEKQPFIADLIRELPEKLEKDKAEKNRNKALKKHNN